MWSWWQGSGGERFGKIRRVGKAKRAHQFLPKLARMVGTARARLCPPYTSPKSSPSPAVLPDLFADHAVDAGFSAGGRHDRAFGGAAGDFQKQLGADCFLELIAVLD